MWNKDELRGTGDQIKGRMKQGAGSVTNKERLRQEGMKDEAAGKTEKAVGKARRKTGEAIKDVGNKVGR
jgi:uncharacterized protein YjbJ (UPF0337 family)